MEKRSRELAGGGELFIQFDKTTKLMALRTKKLVLLTLTLISIYLFVFN